MDLVLFAIRKQLGRVIRFPGGSRKCKGGQKGQVPWVAPNDHRKDFVQVHVGRFQHVNAVDTEN